MVAGACLWIVLCGLTACDRVGGSRYSQLTQDADSKSAQGDFERAINLYEAALDDSPRCAEIHYKLAVLYDDKLNDPVSALHHFKRYLALSPNGPHANEVKNSVKHDEIAALTALSGDSVITRSEVARLRNEKLNLPKELESRTASSRIVSEKSAVIEPMLCNRGTLSSLFRENFISHPNIGKRFSTLTKKISATRKS